MKSQLVFLLLALLTASKTYAAPVNDEADAGEQKVNKRSAKIEIDVGQVPCDMNHTGSIRDLLELYGKMIDSGSFKEAFTSGKHPKEPKKDSKRNIYGGDERLPVGSRRLYSPYCAIGYLASGCTATLIGPYHAITAGHCVYNTATNSWRSLSEMTLYRRMDCNSIGSIMYATNAYSVVGYTRDENIDYDYAVIIYRSSNPSPCYLGFGFYNPWSKVGFDVTGYHRDKSAAAISSCSYNSMWFSSCHYSNVTSTGLRYFYRCDTVNNAGSALYGEERRPSSVRKLVYGVHAQYSIATTGSSSYNWGVRITEDRFNQILGWLQANGYNPVVTRS